jgi:hypothetical protein
MRSLRTNAATAPAPTGKVCAECGVRKNADSTAFFCTSLTRDQLSQRCRQCVFDEAKRSRIQREAKNKTRLALTPSRG